MTTLRRFILGSLAVLGLSWQQSAAAAELVQPVAGDVLASVETTCSRADLTPGLPARIRFKIIDENQIEAWAWNQKDQPTPAIRLQAQDISSQPGLALFNVAGQLTVSGDAKLLVTRTALKYRNVGRLLFTNRTTGELSTYHCH